MSAATARVDDHQFARSHGARSEFVKGTLVEDFYILVTKHENLRADATKSPQYADRRRVLQLNHRYESDFSIREELFRDLHRSRWIPSNDDQSYASHFTGYMCRSHSIVHWIPRRRLVCGWCLRSRTAFEMSTCLSRVVNGSPS